MQGIFLLSVVVAAAIAVSNGLSLNSQLNDEWETFKTKFEKKYEPLTELARRLIWEDNLKYIQQHNIEYDLGKHSYYLGLNQFADMTNEEYRTKYLGMKKQTNHNGGSYFLAPENVNDLPLTVDWRTKGYVTPVKNQEQCGSCWAFSTTGSLEGQHFRKTGKLISFSEQQLVDCSNKFGNDGCNGGLMDNAFKYIKAYGIESELTYKYRAQDGRCKYNKSLVVGTCTGYKDIPTKNEVALAKAVAHEGPVSVAIDAGHMSFQLYKGGIYNEKSCSQDALDHGVLVVGYGKIGGKKYWLVKNSWGPHWGMSGYIKMSKDADNQCGIATNASYPLV